MDIGAHVSFRKLTVSFLAFCTIFAAQGFTPANSATLSSCGGPGGAIRLDPVANPLEHATSGKFIGSEKLTGVVATAEGSTGVSVRWSEWGSGSSSLTTYFIYISGNAGVTWSCYRNYGGQFVKGGLITNAKYKVAVIANAGDTWSNAVILDITLTKQGPKQLCIPSNYVIESSLAAIGEGAYWEYSKTYSLVLREDRKKPITYSQTEASNISSLRYTIEYSIDNWVTKAIHKGFLDGQVAAGYNFEIRALSTKVPTKVRAIVDVSHVFVPMEYDPEQYSTNPTPGYVAKPPTPGPGFTSVGCKPLEVTLYPKTVKADPCLVDPNSSKCPVVLVPGENAKPSTTATQPPKSGAGTTVKKTIICVMGKYTVTVKDVKPTCPPGFKKK